MTLLEIIPQKESDELESQLHLFKTYSDLRARVEELVTTRTHHGAKKSMSLIEPEASDDLNVVEFADDQGILQRLERKDGKWQPQKKTTKPKRLDASSGRCFRCNRTTHRIADCKETVHENGSTLPPKSPPRNHCATLNRMKIPPKMLN